MICAKNYETVSTFVEVMQKKLWPLFFRTRCIWLQQIINQHDYSSTHAHALSVNTVSRSDQLRFLSISAITIKYYNIYIYS